MTVRRRLGIHLLVLLCSVGSLAGIAIVGVAGLRDNYSVALSANRQLRELYTIGAHVSAARSSLLSGGDARRELHEALGELELADADLKSLLQRQEIERNLRAVVDASDNDSFAEGVNAIFHDLADASASLRQQIVARQQSADRLHDRTLLAVCLTAAAALSAMLLMSWRQYRSIADPLAALARSTRRLAAGDFSLRASSVGDAEFVSLATSFNQMADELAAIHGSLEQLVARKSRELGQAQRLASIGYLAAGVAHEINNPLGIIAGYGQRTLRKLDGDLDAERIKQTLGVICDEVFRCKKITERLLMLARPTSDSSRQRVDLRSLVEQTISTLATLRPLEGRQIRVEEMPNAECRMPNEMPSSVTGDADALRQVILNLLINAIEATEPNVGQIRIQLKAKAQQMEISIKDNGCGISAERLSKVFEPFVTDQKGRIGTGLGLAIALSITSDHGGTMIARSEGMGTGSEFIVTLPAEQPIETSAGSG